MSGKARRELLNLITRLSGARRADVKVPPNPLLDAGVVSGSRSMYVWATDPALGVPGEHLGILAFHFTASDVAVMGGRPEYVAVNLLLPAEFPGEEAVEIMRQIHEEARLYGASVVTGHTGWYPGVSEPVAVTTVAGRVDRLMLPSNASSGDKILLAGAVGGELLYSLAHFRPSVLADSYGEEGVRRWRGYYRDLSVVDSAMLLSRRGLALAMKDGAEGGLVRALNDLADASGLGFYVEEEKLPIPPELLALADEHGFNPLAASSSGLLVAVVRPEWAREAVWCLGVIGISAEVVGALLGRPEERLILGPSGRRPFPREAEDPYSRLISR
ncbi:MAG: AIR synthase related protein [Candidatus Korarchaeota archaeon]|nr:AIR synthase related protein [Candidatus Korarchaeota archaeon]